MKVQNLNPTYPNIYIDKCSFGRGIFAAQNISKGEVILIFTGKIINVDEVIAKEEKEGANPLQIDTNLYIDLEKPGVFINHHCDPNAGIVNTNVLVALMNIYKSDEIFCDYSTTMSDTWTMECGCSSSNCRKIIKDFHYLPTNVKEKYLKLGIVQDFIVREHNRHTDELS